MNFIMEFFRVSYYAIRMSFQFLYGLYWINKLPNGIIAIFGGKHIGSESPYAVQAYDIANTLVKNNFSVITGGGPGIMLAANCGAKDQTTKKKLNKIHTLGISVHGVDTSFKNMCAPLIEFDFFFLRKWFLIRYSCGFIIFPGGIGTADEFFEVLNLIKTNHMKRVPIVLIGTQYWESLIHWFEQSGIEQGFILKKYRTLFEVTDNLDHAYSVIQQGCKS